MHGSSWITAEHTLLLCIPPQAFREIWYFSSFTAQEIFVLSIVLNAAHLPLQTWLHFHICWRRLINKEQSEVIFTEDTQRKRGIAAEEQRQVSVIQWKLINTTLNKCWRITSLLKMRFCFVNYLVFFLVQALHLSEPDSISQTVNKEISWPPVESNPFCIPLKPVSTVQPSLPRHWDEGKVKLGPWGALGSKGTALSTDAMKPLGRQNHPVQNRISQDLGLESCRLKKS